MNVYVIIIFCLILLFGFSQFMEYHNGSTFWKKAELVGLSVIVSTVIDDSYCLCTVLNSNYSIKCFSETPISIGDVRVIRAYKNGIYYLH